MAIRTIFWDVDTQVDFMRPDGKLYVPGAETIIPNLKRLTQHAREHGIPVVASACAHRPGDAEFAHYPPHCLVGTPGQQKVPETLLAKRFIVPNAPAELPQLDQYEQVILEKQQFDVFTNPNTEAVIGKFGATLHFVLYGVVTEICVACAARGLLQRGHSITLLSDAVRHLDEAKAKLLVEEVRAAGGAVLATAEVVRE
jgi:nicotinamidase/pyrazinamidase